ncbi:MAG TPA: rhodanese-like domain-containing protein [Candidatus Obscuribacterales bacterium]
MTQTLTKELERAVEHFQNKLAFETGPIELKYEIEKNAPLQIIDLRAPELFEKGHIPGAVNVSLEDLEAYLPKLSKDKTTIVYCYNISCHLSTKAALALAKKGYPVKELFGGWEDWVQRSLPVEGKAEASSCASTKSSCAG